MLTYTGINMLPGGDEAPAPEDLAVQMGRICQFGGTAWFTLLAHSFFVGELVWDSLYQKTRAPLDTVTWAWALLHDAHEVVTSDIPRGWKSPSMKTAQEELDRRIMKRYCISAELVNREMVRQIDRRAIIVQGRLLNVTGFNELYPPHSQDSESVSIRSREANLFTSIERGMLNDPRYTLGAKNLLTRSVTTVFSLLEKGDIHGARKETAELIKGTSHVQLSPK